MFLFAEIIMLLQRYHIYIQKSKLKMIALNRNIAKTASDTKLIFYVVILI